MPKLLVNGVNLYYELMGSGKPIVLIAGFTCDHTVWSQVIPELAAEFQVLAIDNRGSGQSDSPNNAYSLQDIAEDIKALWLQLGLKRPSIAGHSMGGAIAQRIAYHYPEEIQNLILCNALIKFTPISRYVQKFVLDLKRMKMPLSMMVKAIMPWLLSNEFLNNDSAIENFIQLAENNPHPQDLVGFERQLDALLAFDSNSWFHEISVPTLVIGSEEDLLCPKDSARLAKGIKNARFVNIPHMGHLPLIERPQVIGREISLMLKNNHLQ